MTTTEIIFAVALAIVLISSLITHLTPYPQARGVVTGLRVVLDVLSFLQHNDSPGTLQVPLLQRSTPPETSTPPSEPSSETSGAPPGGEK